MTLGVPSGLFFAFMPWSAAVYDYNTQNLSKYDPEGYCLHVQTPLDPEGYSLGSRLRRRRTDSASLGDVAFFADLDGNRPAAAM